MLALTGRARPWVCVIIAKNIKNIYGLWPMGYGYKIPANQLEICKHVWPIREYALYGVCVRREWTVQW
jgi:hypothetical protein